MNLAIDVGNSRIKTGIFRKNNLSVSSSFDSEKELKAYIYDRKPHYIIVSSVKKDLDILTDQFPANIPVFKVDHQLPLPFNLQYDSPDTLGPDRIGLVAGAKEMYPDQNLLIIDAGTCITYDFLDKRGDYHGGSITAGLNMRLKALHTFTDNLPLLALREQKDWLGKNTESAILSGLIVGVSGEIKEMMRLYQEKFVNLKIILTGGDRHFLEAKLSNEIIIAEYLLLKGLNAILNYNIQKN